MKEVIEAGSVAPITGAWIETIKPVNEWPKEWSHPSRVRGLKQLKVVPDVLISVAPITGAWIET